MDEGLLKIFGKKKKVQSVPIAALCLYNIQVFKKSLCISKDVKMEKGGVSIFFFFNNTL